MPRSSNLSVELLQTFLLLVDCGGDATRTAKLLDINQPSMSKRLRRLQFPEKNSLEHPWLFREGKKWKLTEEGNRVLRPVRDLVSRYEQLKTFAANGEADRREVRFGCGRQTVTRFVRRAACRFWAEHPTVHLRVSTLSGPTRIEAVANGSLDLAMVAHEESRIREMARRELYVETVFQDRLALVCAPNTRWARRLKRLPKSKAGPSAFVGIPLLLPPPEAGVRVMLDDVLRESGLLDRLDIRLEVSSWSAIMSYAGDKAGVGLVSESAVSKPSRMIVRFLDAKVIPPFRAKIICRRSVESANRPDLTPEADAFYRTLKHAAKRRWE